MTRRSFLADFKLAAAGLVLDQGYSMPEIRKSMGVGPAALRRWVEQLRSERCGTIPSRSKAMTPEQKRIQNLEDQVRRLEWEKEVLKNRLPVLSGPLG
ncbi:transposase [Pseudomonas leptonychotis]|uniref:Transposase n=1 Tax=Pseudomonas leptonychotis TaxID=2448482 RepID=A0A4T1ZY52_9PSED|nr:transposase [Pseudomonas leptonychotis]